MNTLLFTDVLFESDEDWGSFELMHGMAHQKAYDTILQLETLPNIPLYLDMFEFPRENNDEYLLLHWQAHQSNAALLGLVDLPDLSTVDLSDEGQRMDWLAQHALVHFNENQALGIL
jgi:hypothetical protein